MARRNVLFSVLTNNGIFRSSKPSIHDTMVNVSRKLREEVWNPCVNCMHMAGSGKQSSRGEEVGDGGKKSVWLSGEGTTQIIDNRWLNKVSLGSAFALRYSDNIASP